MTLEQQDKKSLSDVRMAKAREFLKDARANLSEGRHGTAVNRSYYAALSAARSILILEGVNPELIARPRTLSLIAMNWPENRAVRCSNFSDRIE